MSDALLELAARCEAASGPSDRLDECIVEAAYDGRWPLACYGNEPINYDPILWQERHCFSPTASLDAAMTLAPEGYERFPMSFKVERFYLGNGAWQSRASVWDGLGGVSPLDTASVATTPALALTAAALRARATLNSRTGDV